MNADPEVMKFFPACLSQDESNALIDRTERSFEDEGFGLWAVEVGGRFVGFTGLGRVTFAGVVRSRIEIGWRFARWSWGNGYATEAASLCLNDAFSRLHLDEVISFTTETNVRSEAVMKRLGMKRRTDLDFDHPRTPGWWGQRHIVYEIAASNWARSRQIDQ